MFCFRFGIVLRSTYNSIVRLVVVLIGFSLDYTIYPKIKANLIGIDFQSIFTVIFFFLFHNMKSFGSHFLLHFANIVVNGKCKFYYNLEIVLIQQKGVFVFWFV